MARLEEKNYTYFTTVRGMCRQCCELADARVFFRDGQVWQQSLCPTCVNEPALIAADQDWYLSHVLRTMPNHAPLKGAKPPKRGCPHDCGPCAWHATPCQLPVISITNACNLRCPICFTFNRPDRNFYKPVEEMRETIDWLIESSGPLDLVNITGGEPTLHPQILDVLRTCERPEIGRITLNSNGITMAKDYELCRRLAEFNLCVILSFNTFNGKVSRQMNGKDLVRTKLRAIENLTRAGVRVALLNVMTHGLNEDSIPGILDLMRQNDNILSLTVQTMTYSGQGGAHFPKTRHVPVDRGARIVCEQSDGMLRFDDFVTRPSCHPLCYLACYMLKSGEDFLPVARFAPRERIEQYLEDSYLIRLGDAHEFVADVINELCAQGQTEYLAVARKLVERLYPTDKTVTDFERQRIAESAVRTIYIHTHMDEDTFDCSRAMFCPDLMPAEPGRLIPACTYNLFYRMMDERFYVVPEH